MSAVIDPTKSSFDEDLLYVDKALSGSEAAFETLYNRYYDKVFSLAQGILLNADAAQDAVQEIFTLVYRNLNRFDRRSKFSTWLFRVAVNRTIQEARRRKHIQRQLPLNDALEAGKDFEEPVQLDPQIQAALATLSPNDRALLVLFYWDEFSLQEIASSLECNVNAAKTRLYRARERFKVAYEELGGTA